MIIEKAGKHAETQDERAKRLFQVGHVIERGHRLFLVTQVKDGYALSWLDDEAYSLVGKTLTDLINKFYLASDKLVTRIDYETED